MWQSRLLLGLRRAVTGSRAQAFNHAVARTRHVVTSEYSLLGLGGGLAVYLAGDRAELPASQNLALAAATWAGLAAGRTSFYTGLILRLRRSVTNTAAFVASENSMLGAVDGVGAYVIGDRHWQFPALDSAVMSACTWAGVAGGGPAWFAGLLAGFLVYTGLDTLCQPQSTHPSLLATATFVGIVCGLKWLTILGPLIYTITQKIGYPAHVTGKSMAPTFNQTTGKNAGLLDSDWVWVNCWAARVRPGYSPARGDVVVYISPKAPDEVLIKRVIATAGDTVAACRQGKDGEMAGKVRVPAGHLWLEGDNAANTVDSNQYGPVSSGLVFGLVTHCYPLSRGWLSPPVRLEGYTEQVRQLHPATTVLSSLPTTKLEHRSAFFYLKVFFQLFAS